MRLFRDREDAAERLADALPPDMGPDWLVLALPRGGVPIGAVLARRLGAPLDILVVKKVGTPGQPELALAAVTGTGDEDLTENPDLCRALGMTPQRLRELARETAAGLEQRRRGWTGGRPAPDPAGRKVLLVDDGVATGTTLAAGVEALRRAGAAEIAVAVPVALGNGLERIAGRVDRVICPMPDAPYHAVGMAYADFPQVDDDTVARLLDQNRAARDAGAK
jgi:putative phosphoribosyl transferase